MADPAGLQDSAIQVHYQQRDAPDGQRQPAPARCLPSPGCGVGDILVSVTTVPVKRCPAIPARARGHGRWFPSDGCGAVGEGGREGPNGPAADGRSRLGAEKLTK